MHRKGFKNPLRCRGCRIARKNKQRNYDTNPQRRMHEITCAKCGNKAQVPFKPVQGKPLYCKSCYQALNH